MKNLILITFSALLFSGCYSEVGWPGSTKKPNPGGRGGTPPGTAALSFVDPIKSLSTAGTREYKIVPACAKAKDCEVQLLYHTASASPDGTKVYLVGGALDSKAIIKTMYVYDSVSRSVSRINLNIPRAAASSIFLQDGVLGIFGGYGEGNKLIPQPSMFDTSTDAFIGIEAKLEAARAFPTTFPLSDGRTGIFGGTQWTEPLTDRAYGDQLRKFVRAELYDPIGRRFSSVGSFHEPKFNYAMAGVNGSVAFISGSSDGRNPLPVIELFDPSRGEFSVLKERPLIPRFGHQAVTLEDGKVFIVGGYSDPSLMVGKTEIWEPSAEKISLSNAILHTPRAFFNAELLPDGKSVLIFGGTGSDRAPADSIEIYNAVYDTVAYIGQISKLGGIPRAPSTLTPLKDGSYLIAGGKDRDKRFPGLERFTCEMHKNTSVQFKVQGGVPPYNWVLVSGAGRVNGKGLYTLQTSNCWPDGDVTIKVTDYVGKSIRTTFSLNVLDPSNSVDSSLVITTPQDGTITSEPSPKVSGKCSTDITDLEATLNGEKVEFLNDDCSTGVWQLDPGSYSLLQEANKFEISGIGKDEKTITASVNVTFDNIAPAVAITSPVDGYSTYQSPINVSGTCDSEASNVWADGSYNYVENNCSSFGQWTVYDVWLNPGYNYFTVWAQDPAGNTSSASISITYNSSSISINAPSNGAITNDPSPDAYGACSTDVTGLTAQLFNSTYLYPDNGLTLSFSSSDCTTGSWQLDPSSYYLATGVNEISVSGLGGGGNPVTAVVNVTFDDQAPSVSITYPTSDPTYITGQPYLSVIYGECATETVNISVSGSFGSYNYINNSCSGGYWYAYDVWLNPGDNTFTVYASDAANNQASASLTITYDNVGPSFSITDPPTDPYVTTDHSITVSGSCDADAVSFTASLNGVLIDASLINNGCSSPPGLMWSGLPTWSVGPFDVSGGDSNYFSATAYDPVGNPTTVSVTIAVEER